MAEDPKTMRPGLTAPTGPVAPPPRVTYRILAESLQSITTEDDKALRRE